MPVDAIVVFDGIAGVTDRDRGEADAKLENLLFCAFPLRTGILAPAVDIIDEEENDAPTTRDATDDDNNRGVDEPYDVLVTLNEARKTRSSVRLSILTGGGSFLWGIRQNYTSVKNTTKNYVCTKNSFLEGRLLQYY